MKNQMELKGYYVVKAVAQEDFPGAVDAYYGYGDADKSGANRWLEYCPTWLGAVVKGKKAAEALRAKFRRAWADDGRQDVEYAIEPLTDMSFSPWWVNVEEFLSVARENGRRGGRPRNPRRCERCGRPLQLGDGYWTCPQYFTIKGTSADDHTSYPAELEEE